LKNGADMPKTLISKHAGTNDWIAVRRQLHRHPELSGKERETSSAIARHLETFLPDRMIRGLGGAGLLAIFEGPLPGPTSWFRAELDALPIEETDRPHRSSRKGVAHLCGHDGHMTVLLRLAELLHKRPVRHGRVGLLFQPAEETGEGAAKVLKSSKLKAFRPDRCFAIHNLPGFPKGHLVMRPGTFTSSVTSLAMSFTGKTSHAAEPDKAVNPGSLIQELWKMAGRLTVAAPDRTDHAIVTPVHFSLGTRDYGITPGKGEIHFTIRTHEERKLREIANKLIKKATRGANDQGLHFVFRELEHFPAVVNDPVLVGELKTVAASQGLEVVMKQYPFPWGEDFSRYLDLCPGVLIGWGAGEECPPLHHPEYDFPDDQIEGAARFFHQISMTYHGTK